MVQADPAPELRSGRACTWLFTALADPRVLNTVSATTRQGVDPEDLLGNGTLLPALTTGTGAGVIMALVALADEEPRRNCPQIAARSPGAHIEPPLLLAFDDGNLAPLPSLPTLNQAEGGGTGITPLPVLQSLAQAAGEVGQPGEREWDASIVKIILGGASNSRDLQDLSTLIGDRDETTN